MGNSGWTADSNTITIPVNAGPSDPRIVITGSPIDIGIGVPLDASILFFWNATDYYYLGVTNLGADFGLLILGAEAPSVSDGHIFCELDVSTSGAFLGSLGLFGRDDAGTNTTSFIIMEETVDISAGDGLALATNTTSGDYTVAQGISAVSMSRGMIDVETSGTTGSITTTETVVESVTKTVGQTLTNRRYRTEFHGSVQSTIANDRFRTRIRQTNAAGTIERDCGEQICYTANTPVPVDVTCLYTGRNVVGETVVLTLVRTAGTGNLTYTSDSAMFTDETTTSLS